MPWDLTDDKSTLVQVMAWCRQATSHDLSQCLPSSMSPYGVTRPQWVKMLTILSNPVSRKSTKKMWADWLCWWPWFWYSQVNSRLDHDDSVKVKACPNCIIAVQYIGYVILFYIIMTLDWTKWIDRFLPASKVSITSLESMLQNDANKCIHFYHATWGWCLKKQIWKITGLSSVRMCISVVEHQSSTSCKKSLQSHGKWMGFLFATLFLFSILPVMVCVCLLHPDGWCCILHPADAECVPDVRHCGRPDAAVFDSVCRRRPGQHHDRLTHPDTAYHCRTQPGARLSDPGAKQVRPWASSH